MYSVPVPGRFGQKSRNLVLKIYSVLAKVSGNNFKFFKCSRPVTLNFPSSLVLAKVKDALPNLEIL